MQRRCAGVELLTRCLPSSFSPESRLSSVFCQHNPLQFKLRGTERRWGQNDGHCVIQLGLLRPRTILLQEGRAWLFSWHFYGCCTLFLFSFGWEGKEYWNVLRLFLCAARVFVVLFLKGGAVAYVAGSQTGLFPHPSVTKFAFNCS